MAGRHLLRGLGMSDFRTDDLVVRATERIAYGYIDYRAYWGPTEIVIGTRDGAAGALLWPFDAECRGYDMELFKGPWAGSGAHLWA